MSSIAANNGRTASLYGTDGHRTARMCLHTSRDETTTTCHVHLLFIEPKTRNAVRVQTVTFAQSNCHAPIIGS